MAQWTETLEPYVKVQERVRTAAITPTAGEDLVIGVTLISDAGPSTPTLITSQSEFLKTYSSTKDLTCDYVQGLNKFYTGDDNTLAATMWSNAYRLAGSNTMLVVRASKSNNMFFAKPLQKGDLNTYLLKDGELLKKMNSGVKFVLDSIPGDASTAGDDGWSINVNGIGIFGNRTTDEGAQYDYFTKTLPELVDNLNETSRFFSPDYRYFTDKANTEEVKRGEVADEKIVSVVFDELYLGSEFLDTTNPDGKSSELGLMYLVVCQPNTIVTDIDDPELEQKIIDLNSSAYSGFVPTDYYALNTFNSATNLKVRIRRFNHDAVVTKELSSIEKAELTENGESPYTVLGTVLDTYTNKGTKEPSELNKARDFFEIAVQDPSVNDEVSFFNIGNIIGRGDIEESELNSLIEMIQVELPDDLHDLNLNYYGYGEDDFKWEKLDESEVDIETIPDENVATDINDLYTKTNVVPGDIYKVGADDYYKYCTNGDKQIWADLSINPDETKIISVNDSDLKRAIDQIVLDEVYITEGLSDLGNTETSFQNYLANIAKNENYFYPISTINSTNYMTIGNSATKISNDSYKLYLSAPWDIDTGTLGWKYYASPSVLYWEAVSRNRANNEEFRGILGQTGGVVNYQRPVTEFNKKTRQLLLSKKVNTVVWNNQTNAWNMNDNYTKQTENTIMNDEGNSRLMIRISKAIPVILRQFIGRKISDVLCTDIWNAIDRFFKITILPMVYTVDDYEIFCKYDELLARKNKVKVRIAVRYARTLKYIDVVNDAFDVGMDISGDEDF